MCQVEGAGVKRRREVFAAECARGRRERRGDSLLKVADEVALQAAQETLRVRRRRALLLAAVLAARAQFVRDGRRAGAHVAVEVRGADEEGVADQKEQHQASRRGRPDNTAASGADSRSQVAASG